MGTELAQQRDFECAANHLVLASTLRGNHLRAEITQALDARVTISGIRLFISFHFRAVILPDDRQGPTTGDHVS